MLLINNLSVSSEKKPILKNLNLKINFGEVHAVMGPNGSGKSTLSLVLAGKDNYKINSGEILFKGKNLFTLKPEEIAGEGIFIAFQHPLEIPGVNNKLFLENIVNSIRKYRKLSKLDKFSFSKLINEKIDLLKMPKDLLNRFVNVGFSGGEKKRNDILQMMMLDPTLCVLDETDSGLDIDSLKIISNGINTLKNKSRSFIIITHYQRILNYIKPDYVHLLYNGNIIKSGDFSLSKVIEENGYESFIK